MNSVIEAAHYGVPLIAISLFVDQHRNAKMLEYRKTTIIVPKTDITESNLVSALKTLTQGESGKEYRQKAKTLASMLASRPMPPKERFLKYVNFAINFKDHDDHLDIKLRHHNFFFFYNIDIYAFILIFALIGFYLSFVLLKNVISIIFLTKLKKQKIL
uniref:Glucuronosyltransferase n=1 Tax=Panagrolaimus sp. PS1159 TaxID=55785 RepID=A0AC35FCR1_9BILA